MKLDKEITKLAALIRTGEKEYNALCAEDRKSKKGKKIRNIIKSLRLEMRLKTTVLIITVGHGGKISGKYQTKGKRHTYSDGATIYEGEFNRDIKSRVLFLMNQKGYSYIDLVPEQEDISREEKVERAKYWHNKLKSEGKNSFLIEIHSNAGGGKGCENFVSENASANSWKLAEIVQYKIKEHFPKHVWRGIKERNFDIIHLTPMPANLIEWFFMDNEEERWLLMTDHGRTKIANCLFDIIETYFKLF